MGTPIIEALRVRFNEAAGSIRVITFLSPTCTLCRYGQGVIRALFEEFPDERLTGLVVWVPMLPTDNADTARFEQDRITDPRLACWFDEDKAAANAWSSLIGLPITTWDVYAVYDHEAVWEGGASLPSPAIWMHQLPPTPATQPKDRLDPARLADAWLRLLGRGSQDGTELAGKLAASGRALSERPDSAAPRLDA